MKSVRFHRFDIFMELLMDLQDLRGIDDPSNLEINVWLVEDCLGLKTQYSGWDSETTIYEYLHDKHLTKSSCLEQRGSPSWGDT